MNSANKYAIAFINIFGDECSYQDIVQVERAATFLNEHRRALFLLQVPILDQKIKQQGLNDFADRFHLPGTIKRLIDLLINDGRADLLLEVLEAVAKRYYKKQGIHAVVITSALPLLEKDCQELEQIIGQKIKGICHFKYALDQSLIAGIRITTDTLLWEYSIDKQLRNLYCVES